MQRIYLAANYINGTDPFEAGLFDNVGFGHLQLVQGTQEIEVQAPFVATIPFWGNWQYLDERSRFALRRYASSNLNRTSHLV